MSEDSIVSDFISCKAEACAPLLPPRKRLLAGLKQNGWCSASSSSCGILPVENHLSTEASDQTAVAKREERDETEDRASLQCLSCPATENANSHQKTQRKSKRQGTSLTEKSSKGQRSYTGPNRSPVAEEARPSFVTKLLADTKDPSVLTDLQDEEAIDGQSRDAVMAAINNISIFKKADIRAEPVMPNVGLTASGSTATEDLTSEEAWKSSGKPAKRDEAEDRASLQCLSCPATESANSHQKSQRKSKRQGTSLMEKSSKGQRSYTGPKRSPVAEEAKSSFVTKLLADTKDHPSVLTDPQDEEAIDDQSREAVMGAINSTYFKEAVGAESVVPNVGLTAAGSTAKEDLTSKEAWKSRVKPASKSEDEGGSVVLKPRKGANRQEQNRNKAGQHKKQDMQHGRSTWTPPFLSDEDFARQLHRAMNSSPRISRCQSLKEEKLSVATNRKHYPGG